MNKLPLDSVLLLIDVQKGMDEPVWGERNNPLAESNIAKLLTVWRESGRPVYHVQHLSLHPQSPLREGLPGCDFKDEATPRPEEPLFQKHVNSAFIGTELESRLRENGYDSLVIAGLTTQHCVSTTTRMAGNLGFDVYLVSDATAAFDATGHDGVHFSAEQVHAVSLATLHGEFCTVVDTEAIITAVK